MPRASIPGLYRAWKKDGDGILSATVSRTLGDAITRRTGRIGSHVLTRSYQHLYDPARTDAGLA